MVLIHVSTSQGHHHGDIHEEGTANSVKDIFY